MIVINVDKKWKNKLFIRLRLFWLIKKEIVVRDAHYRYKSLFDVGSVSNTFMQDVSAVD